MWMPEVPLLDILVSLGRDAAQAPDFIKLPRRVRCAASAKNCWSTPRSPQPCAPASRSLGSPRADATAPSKEIKAEGDEFREVNPRMLFILRGQTLRQKSAPREPLHSLTPKSLCKTNSDIPPSKQGAESTARFTEHVSAGRKLHPQNPKMPTCSPRGASSEAP